MKRAGSFLGIPYNWRWPTWSVIKKGTWNREDRRVFVPAGIVLGWSINGYEVLRRLGLVHRT